MITKENSYEIAEIVKMENTEFRYIKEKEILKVSDILDEEIEQGNSSFKELQKIAYRELYKYRR